MPFGKVNQGLELVNTMGFLVVPVRYESRYNKILMKIISDVRSPNFSDLNIPVEFLVLHYTAATLERTLELFLSTQTEVSSHLVIDRDGVVYELVECLDGVAKRAWHAGKSLLDLSKGRGGRVIHGLNDCSIGIELVNLNGNVFSYSEAQYASLFAVIESLKGLYPALQQPEAIVGHEHISGFRGKSDPGRCFEWQRLFAVCYPNQGAPPRANLCSEPLAVRIRALMASFGVFQGGDGEVFVPVGVPKDFFGLLSALLEASLFR
jgi:N-acetylmuramoyl-L-alanine amidase